MNLIKILTCIASLRTLKIREDLMNFDEHLEKSVSFCEHMDKCVESLKIVQRLETYQRLKYYRDNGANLERL